MIKPWGLRSGVSTSGRPPCPCDSGDGKVAQHRDWEISAGRLYGSRRPSSARRCTSQCPLVLDALTRSSSVSRSASSTSSPLPWELSIKRKRKEKCVQHHLGARQFRFLRLFLAVASGLAYLVVRVRAEVLFSASTGIDWTMRKDRV